MRGRNISTREPEMKEQLYQGTGGEYISRHDFLRRGFHLLCADIINLKCIGIKKKGRGGKSQHSPHSV